jgi:hypothetical protein
MTDTSATTVGDAVVEAAVLVRFGLSPRLRPSRDAEYTGLVVRDNADPEFRAIVRAVAVGQGLLVLACDRMEGIVLVPSEDSPYRVRLSDYVLVQSSDTRLLHGVVQLAIAATAYPTAAALEDSGRLVSISATQVYERIRAVVDDEHAAVAATADASDPDVEPVWRVIRRLRAADTTPDGRDTPHNVIGAVRKALRWLEERGLADEVRGEADVWRLRDRYRLQVLAAGNAALDAMRADGQES